MAIRLAINVFGRSLLRIMSPKLACQQYNKLAHHLYPDYPEIVTREEFLHLLDMHHQMRVFRVRDGEIVSTAQATLVPVFPNWQVVISNVVTLPWHEERGHGLAMMEDLLKHAKKRWGEVQFVLTNNSTITKSGSFTKNGWAKVHTSLYTHG